MSRRNSRPHNELESTFELQLTSMVDMMTIILIFLVSSYSMSSVLITPADQLKLPNSMTANEAVEALKLVVNAKGIFVEDKQIVEFSNGSLRKEDLESDDPSFIRPLFEELDRQAKKTRDISSKNETVQFEGKIIMQADQDMSYGMLKKVMYTSSVAGYADLKMATINLR